MGLKYDKKEAKAYAKENLKGIWAAIPYPFDENGNLDLSALRSNMRHMIDALQIDGFFCGGLVGECWSISNDERKAALEVVVEECKGKAQVIAHTGHSSPVDAIEMTKHAEQIGADYAIMMNPYLWVKNENQAFDWFEYVCKHVNIGVSLFNSFISGYNLSPRGIAKLAEIENIIAVKNPVPMAHTLETRRLAGDAIIVIDPYEENWLVERAFFGQQVFNSEPTPYLYQTPDKKLMKEYTDLIDQGNVQKAIEVSYKLNEARKAFKKWVIEPWSKGMVPVQNIKYWMDLMGMVGGPVRPPVPKITEEEKREMRGDLIKAGLIQG